MFGSAADSSNADVKQEPRDVELTKASVTDAQPSVFEDQLNEETSKAETQLDGGIDSQASTDNVATERSEDVQEIQTGAICDQEEVKPNSLVAQLPDETAKKTSEDDGQDVKLPENDAGDTDNQHHSLPEESPEDAEKEFGDESNRATQCHVSDSLPKDTTDGVPQTASEYPLADDAGTSNASYVLMPSEFLSGQPTDGNNGETLSLSGGTDVAAAEANTSIVNVEAEGAKEAADVPLLQLCTDGSTMVLWPVGMEGLPSRFKPVDNTLGVTIPGLQVNLTNSSDLVSSTPVCEKTDPENSVSSGIEPLPKEVESPATANESNLSLITADEAKMQDSCTEGPSETIKYLLTHPAGQDAEGCQSPSVEKLVTRDSDLSKIEIAREPAEKHIRRSILNKPPLAAPTAAWDMLRNSTVAGPVVNTSLIPVPSDDSEGSMSASCECDPVLNQSSSTNVEVSCGSENISLKTSQPISDTTDDTSANDQLKESSSYCDSETPLLKATVNSISKELDSTTPKEMQCTGCDMKHDTAISCPTASPCSVSDTFVSTAEDSHNNVSNDYQEPVSVTSESLKNVSQPDSETETDGPTCEGTSLPADATGSETGTLAADDCNLNTSPNNISTEECIVEKSSIFEEITDCDKTMTTEESLSGAEVSVLNEPIVAISKNQVQEDGPHVTYTDNVTEEPVAQETVSEHSQVDVCNLNVVYTPLPEFCEVNVTLVPAVSYDIGENEPSIVSVVEDVPMNETVTTSVSVMGDESKSEMVEAVSVPVVGNESEVETLEVVDGQSEKGVVDSVDGEVDQALETSSTVDSETLDTASLVDSNFENETEHAAEVRDSISDDEMVETTSAGDDEPENEAVVTASIIDLKAECETEEVPVEVGCPVNEIVSPVDAEIENVPINETVEIVSVGDNLYEGETVETTSATGSEFEHETTAQAVLVDLSENETPVEAESAANIICDSGMVTNVSTTMHDIAIEGQVTVPGLSILSDTLENEVGVVEVAVGHEGEEEEESSVSAPVKSPEPVVETKLVTPGMNSTWENAVQTAESVSKNSISATGNLPESETGVNVSATNNTLRNEMSAVECETDEASEKETVPGLISANADGIAFEDDKSQSGTPVVSLRDEVTNKVSPGYVVMEENSSQASCSVYDSNFVPVVTETDTLSNIVVTLSDVSCGGPSQMEMATLPETGVTLPNPDQNVSLLDSAAAPQIKTVITETTSSASGLGENVSVRDTHLHQKETAAFVMTDEAASTSLIPVCSAPDDKTSVLHVVSSGDIHGVGEFSPAETVICDIPGKESTSMSVIYSASLEKNSAPVVFSSCSGKVTPAISSVYSTVLLNDDAATSLPVTCGKVIPAVPVVCNIVSEKEAAVVPVVYNSLCGMEPANISVIDSNMSGEQMSAVAAGCSNEPVKVRATSASGMYGSVPGEKTVLGSTAILPSDSHVAETVSSLPVACSALPANLLLTPQPSVTSGIVSGTATVTTLTCSGALPKKTGPLLQTCSTIASDKSASLTCNRVVQSTAPFISSTVSSGVLGTVHIPLTCNDVVETSTCSSSMVSEVMDSSSLTCGTIESEKKQTPETLRNDRMTSACLTCCSQGPEKAAHIPLTCSDVVLEDTMLASQTCGNAVPVETAATLLACSNVVSKEVAPAPQTCSSVIPERTVPTLLTGSNIVQEETAPAQLTCSSAVPEDTATLLAYSDVVSETVSTPQTCGTVVPEETVPITLTCSKATPEETKPLHLTCGNVPGLDILALSVTNNFVPETENPAPLVEDGISSGADAESESLVSPKVSIPIGNPHTEGLMSVLSKCYNSAANTNKSNQHLDEVTARSENTGFFNPGACNKSLTKCTPSSENNFRLKNTSKNSSFDYLTHSTGTDGGSAKCWKYEASVPQNIQKNPRNEAGKQQLGDLISSSAKHLGETESVKSLGEDVRILMEEQEQDSDSDPLVVLSRVAVAKISESAMKSEENSKKESDYTGVTTLNFESELELEVVPEAIMEGDILYDDFPGSVPFHTVITPDANATLETPPDCRKMMQYLSDTSRTLKHSLPPLSPPVPLLNLPHRYKSETPAAHCLSFDNFEDSTQAKHIKVTDSVPKPGPSLNPSPN
ncbi:Hypothetical predicted protein [Octopus vulgaris]|uniref:Uncharacterized protein n=1 Tax=Octopus vulgaris TaxID=6645 RepID=A0AA36BXH2_OCTVU|nr:Hypothetical predicted protein [Octopus vulgaris]